MSKKKYKVLKADTYLDLINFMKSRDKHNLKIMLNDNNIITKLKRNIEESYEAKATVASPERVNYVLIRIINYLESRRVSGVTKEKDIEVKVLQLIVEHVNEVIEFDAKLNNQKEMKHDNL